MPPTTGPCTRTVARLLLAAAVPWAWQAHAAEPDPGIKAHAWLEPLIVSLDSADADERLGAGKTLEQDPRLSLDALEWHLAQPRPLTAEQRERLTRAGRRIFDSTPRAAMGVQFARSDGASGGVEIAGTVQGFDSFRQLRAGDIIRSIGGVRTTSQASARCAIISHDPGELVPVELLRRGEPMIVNLRLGSFAELTNAVDLNNQTLDAAWGLRLARLPGSAAEHQIDAGWTLDRWVLLEDEVRRAREAAEQARRATPQDGSTPREPEPHEAAMLSAGGSARTAVGELIEPDFALARSAVRNRMADNIRTQITILNQNIRNIEQQLKGRVAPVRNRRFVENQLTQLKRSRDMLRQQLRQVEQLQEQP
jgi:hypothetical protein